MKLIHFQIRIVTILHTSGLDIRHCGGKRSIGAAQVRWQSITRTVKLDGVLHNCYRLCSTVVSAHHSSATPNVREFRLQVTIVTTLDKYTLRLSRQLLHIYVGRTAVTCTSCTAFLGISARITNQYNSIKYRIN